jgi:hypothetical protein
MKKMIIAVVLVTIMAATSAKAVLTLDFTGQPPVPEPTHIPGSSNPDAAGISAAFGGASVGDLLFKQEVDGDTEGSLLSSYTVVFEDPQFTGPITITFNGGDYANATFLLVKDGDEGSYVWDLRGVWDGKETISITGNLFDVINPNNNQTIFKDVSHVEFWGASVPEVIVPVPEPTTIVAGALLLLPFGASMVRIMRKKREA